MRTTRDAYKNHYDSIKKEFSNQAPRWAKEKVSPLLESIVARCNLRPDHIALDVAAGSGLLARAMSPYVKQVAALDITPAMIQSANLDDVTNVSFEQGMAENLPFPDDVFDIVATRFSIHHFLHAIVAVREMRRVCRPNGTVLIIDLVSPENEALAKRYNQVERLRDPTHTEALQFDGLKRLVEDAGLEIWDSYMRDEIMELDYWLQTLSPESNQRQKIIRKIDRELNGYGKTGLRPFKSDERVMFVHTWGIVVATKVR